MKRIFASLLILACLSSVTFGVIPAGAVWEVRTTGAQASGGGFCWTSLVNATYKWTASASGTNEYYCEIAAGGDPSLVGSGSVTCDGNYNLSTAGAVGSLAAGQHAFGDNDKLGYTTPYVRLANGLDPDAMIARGRPGYVSYGAGGTDYSQQANAQMSATDICIVRGDTTQVYRSGATKWAQDYDNNILHITAGAGHTQGWFHVVSVDANDDAVLDRAAGTAGSSSGTGAVGGAFEFGGTLDDDFMEAGPAGTTMYIGGGNHTQLGETASRTGTSGSFYCFGYNASRGDNPIGTDRSLIDCGAYAFGGSNTNVSNCIFANLRFTGSGTSVFLGTIRKTQFFNLQSTCTNVSGSNCSAFSFEGWNVVVGCEGSVSSTGSTSAVFNSTAADCTYFGCYAHDSKNGFYSVAGSSLNCFNSVIDTCTTGINWASMTAAPIIANCTFWGNTTDVSISAVTSPNQSLIVNNIFTGTSGIVGHPTSLITAFGNVFNCTTPFNPGKSIFFNTFADPGLNAPATGDFRIGTSDTNVYEQGVDVGYFTTAQTYDE